MGNRLVRGKKLNPSKKEDGKNIVQDDFELICWDVVTSPSTPGSWIYNESPSREQQMSESKENKDKDLLCNNLSRDNFILNFNHVYILKLNKQMMNS